MTRISFLALNMKITILKYHIAYEYENHNMKAPLRI